MLPEVIWNTLCRVGLPIPSGINGSDGISPTRCGTKMMQHLSRIKVGLPMSKKLPSNVVGVHLHRLVSATSDADPR
jgi:hypothetical protein